MIAVVAAAALIVVVDGRATTSELTAQPLGQPDATAGSDGAEQAPDPADPARVEGAEDTLPADEVAATPLVGEVEGLGIHLPAAEAVVVGFHEASSASYAIAPIGRLVNNENTTRFEPIDDRVDGVDYHILSSRGRIHPPTSAVDVVMEDDVAVLAPVSGLIADVREYELYGRHVDHRVEIHPFDAPHLRIVLVHVTDVRVQAGDLVSAGTSVLAGGANRFPFSSQIDRETEPDRWPHVHLEVQPIDAPRPGDPVEE